jgi:hypothetical protein
LLEEKHPIKMLNSLKPMQGPAQPRLQLQTAGQVNYHRLNHTGKVFCYPVPAEQKGGVRKRWSTFKDMSEEYTYLPQGRSNIF